jgi:hypothetical protein
MATLLIEFNCMCVLVPDPLPGTEGKLGIVHVLMPSTEHPLSACNHGGPERHVVRMLHPSFAAQHPRGLSMDGWALELGPRDAAVADTTLEPAQRVPEEARVVDLSGLTGQQIPRRLVERGDTAEVNARISLRSGRLAAIQSEATWDFNNTHVDMAFRFVWEMEVDPEEPLRWESMDATARPPITKFSDLGPHPNYQIAIYHVPDHALPPDPDDEGRLQPSQVKDHFRALYVLFGISNPSEELLPQPPAAIGTAHCGSSSAQVTPPPTG